MTSGVLGVVTADRTTTDLGTRPRLEAPFCSTTVIGSACERLRRCTQLKRWVILAPATDTAWLAQVVPPEFHGTPRQGSRPPWHGRIQRGRKWALHTWAGGLAGSSFLDEGCLPAEFLRLADIHAAEWIVHVSGAAAMVDPQLVDTLIERAQTATPRPPFMVGSIPPGLAGVVYHRSFLAELAEKGLPPGFALAYHPWDPKPEWTEQLFAYKAPIALARTRRRFLADSQPGLELLRRLAACDPNLSSLGMVEALERDPDLALPAAPDEIEIELTTRRRARLPLRADEERPDLSPEIWRPLLEQYASATDVGLVTLGGHGDPLEHPGVAALLNDAHRAGIYGLSLMTLGLALDADMAQRLLDSPLDILCVELSADQPETYRRVHGVDGFDQVVANVMGFLAERRRRQQVHPLVAVALVRREETLADLPGFYDRWSEQADGAVLLPYSDLCGRRPADRLLTVEPPCRTSCRRLERRLVVHSNGRIVACAEDIGGVLTCGGAPKDDLLHVWREGAFADLRRRHRAGLWAEMTPCQMCHEWFREA